MTILNIDKLKILIIKLKGELNFIIIKNMDKLNINW